jgi:hypothetical protein
MMNKQTILPSQIGSSPTAKSVTEIFGVGDASVQIVLSDS